MKQSIWFTLVLAVLVLVSAGAYWFITTYRNTDTVAIDTSDCVLRDGVWVSGNIHCTPGETRIEYTDDATALPVTLASIDRTLPKVGVSVPPYRNQTISAGVCTLVWNGAYAYRVLESGALSIVSYELCNNSYVGFFRISETDIQEITVQKLEGGKSIHHFEPVSRSPIEFAVFTVDTKQADTKWHIQLTNELRFVVLGTSVVSDN